MRQYVSSKLIQRNLSRALRAVLLITFIFIVSSAPQARAAGNCLSCANKSCVGLFAFIKNNPQLAPEIIQHKDVTYEVPKLSSKGFELYPRERILLKSSAPVLKSIAENWNLREFDIPREPLPIGTVPNSRKFSQTKSPRVLELPIKTPGSEAFHLPLEFEHLRPVLQQIIDFERSVNPAMAEYYAYLTFDQGLVKAGTTQRRAGSHVDGFQGVRQGKGYKVDHSYIVSDAVPTVFYNQPFETRHLNVAQHNFFIEMDRQVDEVNAVRATPYQIYFMDAYALHRADYASQDTHRTILRVTFSKYRYDRLGETDNPLIPAWKRELRSIPESLGPWKPNSEEYVGPGFVPEVSTINDFSEHTLDNPVQYAIKQLGQTTVDHIKNAGKILVVQGRVPYALEKLKDYGWSPIEEIEKPEGFHRILRVKHRTGVEGVALVRINTPERLVHIHALLKIMGVGEEQMYTMGRIQGWRREFFSQMKGMATPTAIIYGMPNTILDAISRLTGSEKARSAIADLYSLRRKPIALTDDEMSNMYITSVRMQNGRVMWLVPNLYGSMAKDFFVSIRALDVRYFAYFGTVGALNPSLNVGEIVIPITSSAQRLGHKRFVTVRHGEVPTFLIETKKWFETASKEYDTVDVELNDAIQVLSSMPNFSAYAVVSDVLGGPNRRDISRWSYEDGRRLVGPFSEIIKTIFDELEISGDVAEAVAFPMVP